MRQLKFLAIAFTLLLSVVFTSCMDSGTESNTDAVAYVTIQESTFGGVTLLTDEGFKLHPSNPEVLKISATEYAKRAQIGIQWAEGVTFDGDKSKTYKMTIVAPLYGIDTKKYCDRPDTIQTTYPLVALVEKGSIWGAHGQYLTAIFKINYQRNMPFAFDLFPIKAENDQLTMKICQTVGQKDASIQGDYRISFQLPSARMINEMLTMYEGKQSIEGGELIVPANDSISVKLVADGVNNSFLETEFVKMKILK